MDNVIYFDYLLIGLLYPSLSRTGCFLCEKTACSCTRINLCVVVYRNIVSTVNLACPLDLKAIALQARNAEYNPKVGLI